MSLLFLLVVLNALLVTCDSQPKTIFLLGGQSNMSGRGGVTNHTRDGSHIWDGVVPLECQPNPSILKLDANLNWVEAHEPLHNDIDVLDKTENVTYGIGPGMPFAHAILKMRPNFGSIGLVPCAHQKSHIGEWQRGKELYNLMIKRAESSIKTGGVIGGLLWWQGGSDAKGKKEADSFYNNTVKFYNDIRTDLKLPNLPIMQVLIPITTRPFTKEIRAAQLAINITNLKTADSSVLPFEEDKIHVSTQGQVLLGTELAKQYLSLNYQ